jgi:hypothetical protein
VFPDKPITKKPQETRMGKGKGAPEGWVAVIKPGRIIFEMEGVSPVEAKAAMRLAAARVDKPEDRTHEPMLVAVNFSERTSTVTMPNGSSSGQVLLSTDGQRREFIWDPRRVLLGPQEGVLVRLT